MGTALSSGFYERKLCSPRWCGQNSGVGGNARKLLPEIHGEIATHIAQVDEETPIKHDIPRA